MKKMDEMCDTLWAVDLDQTNDHDWINRSQSEGTEGNTFRTCDWRCTIERQPSDLEQDRWRRLNQRGGRLM